MVTKITCPEVLPERLKEATETYLLAKVYYETMREQVDEVHDEIFAGWKPIPIIEKFRRGNRPEFIEKYDGLYLASDEDANALYAESNKRLRACGLKPDDMKDEFCPALVANRLLTEAQWELVDAAEEFEPIAKTFGESPHGDSLRDRLLCLGLEKYNKFIELVSKMVGSHSDFKAPTIEKLAAHAKG